MFGASPANPHRYTKFRKLMLGLKNKGGAWTSELLILFLLHDITVFILLGPSAFAPSKEDALCYYCIFPSLRFDQTFFFFLASAVKVSASCSASLASHRDLCSNRIPVLSLVKTSNLCPRSVMEKAVLNLPPHHQSHPTSLFSLLSMSFHLLKQN